MPDDQLRYAGSKGGLAACAVGLVFVLVIGFPFFFAMAWGGSHCSPMPECQRAGERVFAGHMAVIVALAALLGLAVRAIVRWRMQLRMDARLARQPWWALAVLAVVGALLLLFLVAQGSVLDLL